MDAFELRDRVISDYGEFGSSCLEIPDPRLAAIVGTRRKNEVLWPKPLIPLDLHACNEARHGTPCQRSAPVLLLNIRQHTARDVTDDFSRISRGRT